VFALCTTCTNPHSLWIALAFVFLIWFVLIIWVWLFLFSSYMLCIWLPFVIQKKNDVFFAESMLSFCFCFCFLSWFFVTYLLFVMCVHNAIFVHALSCEQNSGSLSLLRPWFPSPIYTYSQCVFLSVIFISVFVFRCLCMFAAVWFRFRLSRIILAFLLFGVIN